MTTARRVAVGALLVALVFIAYFPALRGTFIWDDFDYIQDNASLRSVPGLFNIWLRPGATPQYYPLVFTSFWFEMRFWGTNPLGYHIVNVLLHAASALLLLRLMSKLGIRGGIIAAMILALHPLHVESVAWISERKNVLSGALALLALNVRFNADDFTGRRRVIVVLLFFGALLSKSVVASLPAVVLVILWWKHGRITLRDLIDTLPMLLIGLIMGIWTATVEVMHVGARGAEFSFTFVERFVIAGRAVCLYLSKLVVPVNLTFSYPKWTIDSGQWWWLVASAAAGCAVIALWSARKRIGRGPAAVAMIYLGVLFPALGFANIYPFRYSFVADHFQYHASAAMIVGVGWLLSRVPWTAIPIVAALGTATWFQSRVYVSDESIWKHVVARNPQSWLGRSSLAAIHRDRGELRQAEAELRKAIEIAPRAAEPAAALGSLLLDRGYLIEATELFKQAVENEPQGHLSRYMLATCYTRRGDDRAAIEAYREAIRFGRNQPIYYNDLGIVLLRTGQTRWALEAFEKAIALDPTMASANLHAGKLYAGIGRRTEAINCLQNALERDPSLHEAYEFLNKLKAR